MSQSTQSRYDRARKYLDEWVIPALLVAIVTPALLSSVLDLRYVPLAA